MVDNLAASAQTTIAFEYIKYITDANPDLFVYPYGGYSSYLADTFFLNFGAEHRTVAAFTTQAGFISRNSNPYKLNRFMHAEHWSTGVEFQQILDGHPPPGC